MIRVLHIISTLETGGAEVLLGDLARRFGPLGVHAEILCLSSRPSLLQVNLTNEGIPVIYGRSASPYSPLQVLSVRKQILRQQYDIVHCHLFPGQLWGCLGARMASLNIPLVTTEHSTWNRRRYRVFRPLDRWLYSQYSKIACIGTSAERALRVWLQPQDLPTTIVPNGIDLARFTRAPETARRQGDTLTTLVCVANLRQGKGHDTLLRAVSLIPGIKLLLAGDGALRQNLEHLVAELRITERVQFLGTRNDVPDILGAADIYVQPSYWEGFGIAAVEAMAAGVPVVASDVPGLSDVVGQAGLLFEAGSVSGLKECIVRLMGDPLLREQVASRAKQRSRQFSVENTAAAYVRLYESLLGARPALSGCVR